MEKLYIYIADDEESECGRCDNLCNGSDDLCINRCESEHGWYGYVRTVIEEERIRQLNLIRKCRNIFEKKDLTADQAERILAILTEEAEGEG